MTSAGGLKSEPAAANTRRKSEEAHRRARADPPEDSVTALDEQVSYFLSLRILTLLTNSGFCRS